MSNSKFNILYVDDEVDNLEVFESNFWKDYNIFLAISAEKGFDILEKEDIDLVITDQRMPVVSGVEFLEKVAKEHPKPLRMILTGYSDLATIVDAVNKGKIYHFITKPWKKKGLQEIINRALEVVKLKQENNLLLLTLKLSNKKLEALNLELESQVLSRTKELEIKNQELSKMLASSSK